MIKHFDKELHAEYLDDIFDFKGQWDVDSRCGLKIIQKADKTIVIATELSSENPGTSVTSFCAPLAGIISKTYNIPPENLVFIVRDPETKSKLSFYGEHFYRVDFNWDGQKFVHPTWHEIDKEQLAHLLK